MTVVGLDADDFFVMPASYTAFRQVVNAGPSRRGSCSDRQRLYASHPERSPNTGPPPHHHPVLASKIFDESRPFARHPSPSPSCVRPAGWILSGPQHKQHDRRHRRLFVLRVPLSAFQRHEATFAMLNWMNGSPHPTAADHCGLEQVSKASVGLEP